MYLQDMKFIWVILSLEQLYTDDNTNDADTNADNHNTNDHDNKHTTDKS